FRPAQKVEEPPDLSCGGCARRALRRGLSRDWGSCRDGCWRMRIVGGLEALPKAGAERAVVDGAADLEQQVGAAPGPAHLLRLGHAPVDQECQSARNWDPDRHSIGTPVRP